MFGLAAIVALIAANAFFVAAEFALVAVNRVRLDQQVADGDRAAQRVDALVRRLSFHLSGAQLGITVTSLVLGFVAGPLLGDLLAPLLEPLVGARAASSLGVVLALALATATQMVTGELVPRSLAIARPDGVARRLATAVGLYGAVFGPVIRLLDRTANWCVRRLGIAPASELSHVRTSSEFELLFRAAAERGSIGVGSADLLTRTLDLANRTAADVLVPRTEVQALPVEATVAELVTRSRRTGHSRFVVFGSDLDDLRGVVHVKAAYRMQREARAATPVADVMAELLAVPESRDLDDLLGDLRAARQHLAVVVDEHGGTAGIVTLEDVLELVVGDIVDEHDIGTAALTRVVAPGEWVLEGSARPWEVASETGLVLPEGPYETLAGFVLDRLGHLPEGGESFRFEDWALSVEGRDRRRISSVRIVAPGTDGRPGRSDDPPGRPDGGGAT